MEQKDIAWLVKIGVRENGSVFYEVSGFFFDDRVIESEEELDLLFDYASKVIAMMEEIKLLILKRLVDLQAKHSRIRLGEDEGRTD